MGHLDVDGHQVWHDVHGDGPRSVALLHGAYAGADCWAGLLDPLAGAGMRVLVPERPGHGRSPDRPDTWSYEAMARHTAAYLEAVGDGPADVVGWSDGAIVALHLALARPDLVPRLALVGQYYDPAGRSEDGRALEEALAGAEWEPLLRGEYAAHSPDGEAHFGVVHERTQAMIAGGPGLDLDALAGLDLDVLVLQGDRDIATLEHALDVSRRLPHGRLAVLPGTHLLPMEDPALVAAVLIAFLSG